MFYLTGTLIIHCNSSNMISATAIAVVSDLLSYTGVNSAISEPTIFTPAAPNPLRMARSSRVDQPPISIVPVPGANAITSVSLVNRSEAAFRTKEKTRN